MKSYSVMVTPLDGDTDPSEVPPPAVVIGAESALAALKLAAQFIEAEVGVDIFEEAVAL